MTGKQVALAISGLAVGVVTMGVGIELIVRISNGKADTIGVPLGAAVMFLGVFVLSLGWGYGNGKYEAAENEKRYLAEHEHVLATSVLWEKSRAFGGLFAPQAVVGDLLTELALAFDKLCDEQIALQQEHDKRPLGQLYGAGDKEEYITSFEQSVSGRREVRERNAKKLAAAKKEFWDARTLAREMGRVVHDSHNDYVRIAQEDAAARKAAIIG